MKRSRILVATIALSVSTPTPAGLYTDDLTRCLVDSTSAADRQTLVRWLFAALAQHPAVSSLAAVEPAGVDALNKDIAALLMRLLTDACAQKTKDAVRYEGASSIEQSFNVLGQVAAADLMSHPEVSKVVAGIQQYLDTEKLEALGPSGPQN